MNLAMDVSYTVYEREMIQDGVCCYRYEEAERFAFKKFNEVFFLLDKVK